MTFVWTSRRFVTSSRFRSHLYGHHGGLRHQGGFDDIRMDTTEVWDIKDVWIILLWTPRRFGISKMFG